MTYPELTMKPFLTILAMSVAAASAPARAQTDAIGPGEVRKAVKAVLAERPRLFERAAPAPSREWQEHIPTREGADTYDCAFSLALGGELKRDGYVGARLLGQTRTLQRAGDKSGR